MVEESDQRSNISVCPRDKGTKLLRTIESIKPIALILTTLKHMGRATGTRISMYASRIRVLGISALALVVGWRFCDVTAQTRVK